MTHRRCTDIFDCLRNLDTGKLERTIESEIPSDAIGADASGRIYLAGYDFEKRDDTYKIYLLTTSGELLSEIEGLNRIYEFVGFDSTNNNFYARADYDAPGSGYGVLAGNAENDKITVLSLAPMIALTIKSIVTYTSVSDIMKDKK